MAIGKKDVAKPKAGRNIHTKKVTESKKSKEELADISRENGKMSAKYHESAYEKSEPMVIDYAVEDMYADIYDPRAKIAPELKIHAAAAFFATGTVDGASRLTGLNHQTISEWKNKSEWWDPVLSKLKKEKNDELDATVTDLIHKTTTELNDRIINGEVQMHQGVPTGHLKPMTGRDLAATLNTLYDKRTMMRGEPTSISGKADQSTIIDSLKEQFEKMAKAHLSAKVVSEQ